MNRLHAYWDVGRHSEWVFGPWWVFCKPTILFPRSYCQIISSLAYTLMQRVKQQRVLVRPINPRVLQIVFLLHRHFISNNDEHHMHKHI